MHSTTKRLTITASALSVALLLCGSPAMAAEAPAATFPHWTQEQMQQKAEDLWVRWGVTPEQRQQYAEQMQQWLQTNWNPEQRQQYWDEIQQKASDLWTKWGLTPEQRQQYAEKMQGWWNDVETMVNPPAEAPVTAPAVAAVAATTTRPTATAPAGMKEKVQFAFPWSIWSLTPQQRQQYWESKQKGR